MRIVTPLLPWLLLLSACSSPPKPPSVDESRKRPANVLSEVELQTCRSELQNTHIAANESQRLAAATMASAAQLAQTASVPSGRNAVYTVLFPYGSTTAQLADPEMGRLVEDARAAPLIVLRGRTDGLSASPAETRVARERAEAVQALLVQAGIEPARIRTTWQPAGDHAGRGRQRASRRPVTEQARRDRDLPRGASGTRRARLGRAAGRAPAPRHPHQRGAAWTRDSLTIGSAAARWNRPVPLRGPSSARSREKSQRPSGLSCVTRSTK
jgi:outer membrane protein OmpA-like peptidoglycan-associated protein